MRELLDAAERRWPEVTDRGQLLLRLVEEGHMAIGLADRERERADRRDDARVALDHVRSLVDADPLQSDQAWS